MSNLCLQPPMDTGCPISQLGETKGEVKRPLGQEGLDPPSAFLEVIVEILILLQMSELR